MRNLPTITDPTYQERPLSAMDRFFLRFIRDRRDLPFIRLSLKITLLFFPSMIVLYSPLLPDTIWWIWATTHLLVCLFVFLAPYTLMLHNTSHRPLYKREYERWNKFIPWVLGPFFGQSPDMYFLHHMGMHHNEGNLPDDKSSTMPFQRDSFLHFMHYFLRFLFIGAVELTQYFFGKKRDALGMKVMRMDWGYIAVLILLAVFVHPGATLMVFAIPLVYIRLGMMSGNWGQHAFVDPDQPDNDYTSSITCINTRYNRTCFNDGYHIGHHLVPNRHWTEMPQDFLDNIDKYAENKALVFDGIDFQGVFFLLIIKRYDILARHLININGDTFASDEEAIAIMRKRTKRFSKEELALYAAS